MRIDFSCPMRSSVPAEATPTATSSAAIDVGASPVLRARFIIPPAQKNRPGTGPGRPKAVPAGPSVAAGAEQLHQQHEQVDEVEIEAQRAHDRLLAAGLVIVALVIHLLDLLRVIRGQTDEDEDADHRDRE